ncbi:MAG: Omp28-related outer membrane protein [Bacteroidota bacterium]|nr:Omp28-related outer membrane protein [Bacteroidota bacterium]
MKKKILTLLALGFSSVMTGQIFVNTNPENKKIILEEFTGIDCPNCPDGHLQATQIHDQNLGNVFLINIHSGSYSVPDASGDLDFRSSFGDALDNQSNLAGYPAATVNRHVFPALSMNTGGTAMSRTGGAWFTAAGEILAQPSCVNVAAEATLDISTRELTVIVEAYYTDNSIVSANKIHVALLQNNIEGPQSGASANPSQVLANGNYNHQHMLRHLLTGQWGDTISSTSTGSFFTNTYTYTIPQMLDFDASDSYNGTIYDLFNLEIIVFISEGNQEILSGNMANITHIVPPGVNLIDLSSATNMTMPTSLCDNNITPEITITNNSAMVVDTFEVSYTLNSNAPITQPVYTSLAAGASTNITFPTITIPSGTNNITYSANTLSGTSYIDNVPNNNIISSGSFNIISPTAFSTSHTEGFEGYANQTPAPNNALLLNPQGRRVFIVDATWGGPNSGGYGNSHNAFRWSFVDQSFGSGDYAELVFEKLDFSSSIGNEITYSYAHQQATGFDNNKLQVLVSTDCGDTWNLASELAGTELATTTNTGTNSAFYPTASDWATDIIDLSTYDGNSDVMIALKGICEGGNNLYIDDIVIDEAPITVVNEHKKNISVYPNPVKNLLTIEGAYTSIDVFDMFGKLVLSSEYTKNINISSLSDGIYVINISKRDETIIKKITITKR